MESNANPLGGIVAWFTGLSGAGKSTIAEALVQAYKTVGFDVPLVVRLEGTEVEAGKKIIAESDVDIITADDLADAAKKVVATLG